MFPRKVLALALSFFAQSSFGLTQCPADANRCGPNPFYGIVLLLAKHCGAVDQSSIGRYQNILKKMVAKNPEAYAKLESDSEFQQSQIEGERRLQGMKPKELREACAQFSKE